MRWLKRLLRAARRNKMTAAGLLILLAVVVVITLYPVLGGYNPLSMSVTESFQGASPAHWFGTDSYGRDLFARVVHAYRTDLAITAAALVMSLTLGVPLGLISGFYGNVVDNVIMRVLDIVMAFPVILLAIAIIAALGPNMRNVVLIIGFVYAPIFARVARGQTLALKNEEYVLAARAMGRSGLATLFRHVLPNSLPILSAQALLQASFAILAISALSFLGLGVQPPQPSLGLLLRDGIGFMHYAVWMSIYPGLAIFVVSLGLNLAGEGALNRGKGE